jgi:hypothetical protein
MDVGLIAPYVGTGVTTFFAGFLSRYAADRHNRRMDHEQRTRDETHRQALEAIASAYWPIVRALDAMGRAHPNGDAERQKLQDIVDGYGSLLEAADKSTVESTLSRLAKPDDYAKAADQMEATIQRKRAIVR